MPAFVLIPAPTSNTAFLLFATPATTASNALLATRSVGVSVRWKVCMVLLVAMGRGGRGGDEELLRRV